MTQKNISHRRITVRIFFLGFVSAVFCSLVGFSFFGGIGWSIPVLFLCFLLLSLSLGTFKKPLLFSFLFGTILSSLLFFWFQNTYEKTYEEIFILCSSLRLEIPSILEIVSVLPQLKKNSRKKKSIVSFRKKSTQNILFQNRRLRATAKKPFARSFSQKRVELFLRSFLRGKPLFSSECFSEMEKTSTMHKKPPTKPRGYRISW